MGSIAEADLGSAMILPPEDPGDCRQTPPDLFARLDEEFHFTIDVCASARNAKCHVFYGREDDGLEKSWSHCRAWCNPPYSDIESWIRKAWREMLEEIDPCDLIVMLIPNDRTDQPWWQELIEPYRDRPGSLLRTRFPPGRIKFWPAGLDGPGEKNQPKCGSVLLIWGE